MRIKAEQKDKEKWKRRSETLENLEDEESTKDEYIFEKEAVLSVRDVISSPKNKHIVILGGPGIGKTCLLRYIALKVSTMDESLGMEKPLLPVLIPLGEYTRFGQDKMVKEFVFYYIKEQVCSLPEEVLEHFLENDAFFFLLDGLDEVVEESERIHISREVERFMARYPDTRIILTSRPAGYQPAALIGGIPHFTLAEFNDDEIKEFLLKWFTFLDTIEEEFDKESTEKRAYSLADIVLRREKILRLARNPLLLTILVLIQRVGGKLPERRADFYDLAVKTIAGSWEIWKGLPAYRDRQLPEKEAILGILEEIGFKLHNEKQDNLVGVEELKIWLKEAMEEEIGHSSSKEINDFIWMLRERAGLLVEKGFNLYGFVHLTFQEYFAAQYIALGRGKDLTLNLIKEKLYSSHWKEVFMLTAAIAPFQQANFIFESILHVENDFEEYIHSNLLFAGEMLGDKPRINKSKRSDIISRLIDLTRSDHIDLLRIEALNVLTKIRKVFQFNNEWMFELLSDGDLRFRFRAMEYFTAIRAEDAEIKERIFELLRDRGGKIRYWPAKYFATVGAEDAEIKERIFELLKDKNHGVPEQAVEYFTAIGAEDAEIKERIFELLKDGGTDVQNIAIRFLSKYARKESIRKAPILFKTEDEHTKRGAYKLMKALLQTRENRDTQLL